MNIGIDFDNTIVRYDSCFRDLALSGGFVTAEWNGGGKTDLRDHLRRQPDGEKIWMKLQGLVYGKYMYSAEMMPGVANFLISCNVRGHKIYIVSHKTEYGHFDPEKIHLRKKALKWMEIRRFFDPEYFGLDREDVFFADTREEKVEKIAQLECDWFIDDLSEVFKEKKFPSVTKKILFGKFKGKKLANDISRIDNWSDILNFLLNHTTDEDVTIWANRMVGQPIEKIEKIPGGGNSRIYRVVASDENTYALKYYPNQLADNKQRLKTEFHTLRFLHQHNITNVPKAVDKDEDLNLGLYEWIMGESVIDPKLNNLKQAINFVEKLYSLSKKINRKDIDLASEACLSAKDLINQINKRLSILLLVSESFPDLSTFLKSTFQPLWTEIRDKSYFLWPIESRDSNLSIEKQTLSASDFGFHNALKDDEKITFHDFEYFGWDDPVKLTADFIWHPAMEFNLEMNEKWNKAKLELFSSDHHF